MLGTLRKELAHWRDTLRARFDPEQPPVVGWQLPFLGCGLSFGLGGPRWLQEQHSRLGSPFTLYVKGQRFTISQDPEFMRHFYTAGLDDVSFFAGLLTFPGFAELIPFGLIHRANRLVPDESRLTLRDVTHRSRRAAAQAAV